MSEVNIPTVAEVVGKLEALGSSEQIALFLEAEEVRGIRLASHMCPVARYVGRETGCRVSANPLRIFTFVGSPGHVDLEAKSPVSQFISRFDAGDYPALDLHPGDA